MSYANAAGSQALMRTGTSQVRGEKTCLAHLVLPRGLGGGLCPILGVGLGLNAKWGVLLEACAPVHFSCITEIKVKKNLKIVRKENTDSPLSKDGNPERIKKM